MNIKQLITFSIIILAFIACNKTTIVVIEEHENGEPKIVREYFKNDTTNYKETQYHIGNIKFLEGRCINGKREGVWRAWYEDGKLWSEGSFKDGKNNGKHVNYYENGAMRYSGEYRDGSRIGTWYFYDTLENIIKVNDY